MQEIRREKASISYEHGGIYTMCYTYCISPEPTADGVEYLKTTWVIIISHENASSIKTEGEKISEDSHDLLTDLVAGDLAWCYRQNNRGCINRIHRYLVYNIDSSGQRSVTRFGNCLFCNLNLSRQLKKKGHVITESEIEIVIDRDK